MSASSISRRARSTVPRRQFVETLEQRTLLAGNVLASQAGTVLTLEGDAYGNQIRVWSGYLPNEVVVQGENGTTVNGSYYPQRFRPVDQAAAFMNSGNDTVKAIDLCLTAIPVDGSAQASLGIDGGRGDDCILVQDSAVRARYGDTNGALLQLVGETTNSATAPTTGNDHIDVCDTSVSAEGGSTASANLLIFGEQNLGGQVTCGNDHIAVTNTCVTATDAIEANASIVQVVGDLNAATDGDSTIGGGNDCIDVSCSTFKASGLLSFNTAFVQVIGDDTSTAGTGAATIGGGNDTISVDGSLVTAADGAPGNFAELDVFGDGATGDGATIGGGNDTITQSYTRVAATGLSSDAAAQTFGDDAAGAAPSPVGQGDDCITWDHMAVEGTSANVQFHAGTGCDFAQVDDSTFDSGVFAMEDGDDVLKFAGNTFVLATLDGGPGYDKLYASGNSPGLVINFLTWEEVYLS